MYFKYYFFLVLMSIVVPMKRVGENGQILAGCTTEGVFSFEVVLLMAGSGL
jgi:hypothetical protein